MRTFRKARTLTLVTAATLLASLGVSGASSTSTPSTDPSTPVSSVTTKDGDLTTVETRMSDGAVEATGTVTINTADLAPSRPACVPSVTEADIQRWMSSGKTTDTVQGTGPNPCTAPRLLGRGSGINIPEHDPHCYGKNMDGNDVHVKACTIFDVKKKQDGRTWWNQKSYLTIWSNDGEHGDDGCMDCDDPERLSAYVKYGDSQVNAWAPSATVTPESGCTTQTTTVTFGGVSSTQETKKCAESFGPWALGTHSSGARWIDTDGAGIGQYRAAHHHHVASTRASSDTISWHWWARWD